MVRSTERGREESKVRTELERTVPHFPFPNGTSAWIARTVPEYSEILENLEAAETLSALSSASNLR